MKVLLVEDEDDMARLITGDLQAAGYVVDTVGCVQDALAALESGRYGVVLLDRRLPDGEGLEVLDTLRKRRDATPIVVLSALNDVLDKVRGLDAGAVDYLVKPFDSLEMRARLRAALRRPDARRAPPIACAYLTFDPDERTVLVRGAPIVLPRRELLLLEALVLRVGRVVHRQRLMDEVYGFDDDPSPNALDVIVSRLRARLIDFGAGVAIHTVRGVGYILDAEAE